MEHLNPQNTRRIVLKVGSALVSGMSPEDPDENHRERERWMDTLAENLYQLSLPPRNQEILIVSSGAVAFGRNQLPHPTKQKQIQDQQAAAAIGQPLLMQAWTKAFQKYGIPTAQILLGPLDLENRRNALNARGTLERILAQGVIPILNENDAVTSEELRYGDNDRLAARIAQLVSADLLILLTRTNGLYTGDPLRNPQARHVRHIRHVVQINDQIRAMAQDTQEKTGSGGMTTKLQAAEIATQAGTRVLIAKGVFPEEINGFFEGSQQVTYFHASLTPRNARKRWIASQTQACGQIHVDAGAIHALTQQGTSLLPVGITHIEGDFSRGDPVAIHDGANPQTILGRGLSVYDQEELQKILGKPSSQIKKILGYSRGAEAIHRNDMVLL